MNYYTCKVAYSVVVCIYIEMSDEESDADSESRTGWYVIKPVDTDEWR